MKKLILLLLLNLIYSCYSDEADDKEILYSDSQLGTNCPDTNYINNLYSQYVLPWEIGKTFKVGQGNCTDGSNSLGPVQHAYDIDMPIGTNIVAMRSGIVVKVIENFRDLEIGTVGAIDEANVIHIEHEDGTEAQYIHLTYNGG